MISINQQLPATPASAGGAARQRPRRELRLFLGAVVLQTLAVIIDLSMPAGYGLVLLYLAVMMASLWIGDRRLIVALACIGTAYILLGTFLAPRTPLPWASVLIGRSLAIATVWLVAVLALNYQRSRAELLQSETTLIQAQRVAEAGQARLRSILETAPEAIITIDERGIVDSFSASAEQLFGYDSSEVIGRNVSMLMPPHYREQHDGFISRYLATGERRIIGIGRVVEAQRKDGSIFPMELAVGEVLLGHERIFTGFVRDLTGRQRLEQELRQSQRIEAVGQLTGGIAHDFNNLLTVIIGNLEMLEPSLEHDPKAAARLREAYETAQLGAELTSRLLAFARRKPLDPKRVDVRGLVRQASKLLRRTLGEGIDLRTSIVETSMPALVDPSQLENAIFNLCINARDAMPNGGSLTLEASPVEIGPDSPKTHAELRPGRYVLISVADTGVGMSPEVRDRAFEPFYTTKPVGSGTGLGLSMVYGFAKQSGGHVQIVSAPNQGAIVQIYLPLLEADAADTTLDAAGTLGTFPGMGETILVVEDDARVRRVTVARLEALGYRVVRAADGPQALQELAQSQTAFDLLFTDMVMPGGLSGVDLARAARARFPALKVLFTTGYAQPEMLLRSLSEDAGWIRKPYTALDLARKLREVLEAPAKSESA